MDHAGSVCQMQITISETSPPSLPAGRLCLFLDTRKQKCWDSMPKHSTFKISLKQDTWLYIKTGRDDVLFSQQLFVKSEKSRVRQRVRSPWSLF
ncbi:DUF3019 domain-containing protein [Alteromonas pelagimontana]|uniref:DUF3019 domain-containing protein n=1 Tax=Alteromonas pelagimontana TaxID=1858656 RepID=A0A6M4MAN5_9ALTE|nr:DUF3019 domain-containing protein [Alteromonas pelagimontana]